MITFQFTVAFHYPVSVQELKQVLARHYGQNNVESGLGLLVNGLPENCIVVSNERRQQLD